MKLLISLSIISLFVFTSCRTVAPYQRQYVIDAEMQMSNDAGKSYNNYAHTIREGTAPASSTKASGGCGCN